MNLPSHFAWVIALAVVLCHATATPAQAHNNKNVIVIVADDLGFQIGCYGNDVIQTPGIDRLAEMGVRFTRATCTTASCSASRSVIMTGLHNHTTGHYGHAHGYNHFSTFETVTSLPVMMADAGYRTCSIGKYHLAPEEVYHFEEYRNEKVQGNRNSDRMAQNAIDWMNEQSDEPFFLYYCSSDPHRGGGPGNFSNYNNKEENPHPGCPRVVYDADDITVPPWLPDQPEVRQELAEYYQAITRFDHGVGRLVDYLQQSGHDKDTLVMLLSDNGPPFPAAKTNLHQPGMNLPLLVFSPEVKQPGATNDARVNWTDLAPSILDFCDIEPPLVSPLVPGENGGDHAERVRKSRKPVRRKFHGRSFLDILNQPHPEGWDDSYASHTFHEITMYYPMRVVIQGDYKLIFNIAHQLPYPFASDLQRSPTWQGVLKRGDKQYGQKDVYSYLHRPRFELYNLADDPWESTNLANDQDHQDELERLQQKMQKWQQETKDPWELKWRYE